MLKRIITLLFLRIGAEFESIVELSCSSSIFTLQFAVFGEKLCPMAVPDNDARILDSLRQIFPQLNDHVLSNCLQHVRETVGENPATIIPGCIDVLLARQTANEVSLPGPTVYIPSISLDDYEYRGSSLAGNTDNDVIFVKSTSGNQRERTNHIVINLTDDRDTAICGSPFTTNNSSATSSCSPVNTGNRDTTESRRNSASRNDSHPISSVTVNSCVTLGVDEGVEVQVVGENPRFDPMKEALKNLNSLFPDVEENYLQRLVDKWSHLIPGEAINNACNELLEMKDYPKKKPIVSTTQAEVSNPSGKKERMDYLKNFSSQVSAKYSQQCLQILQNDFQMISMRNIRLAMAKFHGHYAPSKRYLQEQLRLSSRSASSTVTSTLRDLPSPAEGKEVFNPPIIVLLKNRRYPVMVPCQADIVEELKREIEFMKRDELSKKEEMDRLLAVSLNDKQYEEEGQKIQCGCCYGDAAFEDMVQCLEGHLFCASCLMNYAKEAAFGQGKAALTCMSDGCDGTFPFSQLKKALPINILEKYEDRVQEESLLMAQMEDFVRCPSCDFAVILPLEDKVLKCQNPSCGKETCRYCKEDWSEHFGLKCNEVEKSAQKDVRISYEEKMTMAKIRKCPSCGCEFTKSDGCNKMTCRCGTTMCYICRKPKINYSHFCQHPKDPGKSCTKCTSCSLWTDPTEDDNRAVQELEKEAMEAKRKFEEENTRSDDNPAKKVKISSSGNV